MFNLWYRGYGDGTLSSLTEKNSGGRIRHTIPVSSARTTPHTPTLTTLPHVDHRDAHATPAHPILLGHRDSGVAQDVGKTCNTSSTATTTTDTLSTDSAAVRVDEVEEPLSHNHAEATTVSSVCAPSPPKMKPSPAAPHRRQRPLRRLRSRSLSPETLKWTQREHQPPQPPRAPGVKGMRPSPPATSSCSPSSEHHRPSPPGTFRRGRACQTASPSLSATCEDEEPSAVSAQRSKSVSASPTVSTLPPAAGGGGAGNHTSPNEQQSEAQSGVESSPPPHRHSCPTVFPCDSSSECWRHLKQRDTIILHKHGIWIQTAHDLSCEWFCMRLCKMYYSVSSICLFWNISMDTNNIWKHQREMEMKSTKDTKDRYFTQQLIHWVIILWFLHFDQDSYWTRTSALLLSSFVMSVPITGDWRPSQY